MRYILTLILLTISLSAQEIPHDYQRLRDIRSQRISEIDKKYIIALEKLKLKYTKQGNLEIALLINEEIKKYKTKLVKSYVSNVRGFAGLAKYTHNNVYSFDIKEVGKSASITFWAFFDLKGESNGIVYLSDDKGREKQIYKWKSNDFKFQKNQYLSYDQTKPRTIDITKFVNKPGRYKIRFAYASGEVGLSILRVSIDIKE